jgi:glycerol-3-phosphate dehydrogenase
MRDDPSLADIAIPGQSYLKVEFLYGAQSEMATSLIDLLTRRTRAHLHDARSTLESAPAIAELVAPALQWDQEECERQLREYRALVTHEFSSAGLQL